MMMLFPVALQRVLAMVWVTSDEAQVPQGSPWSRDGVRMLLELRAGPAGGGTASTETSSVTSLLNLSHLRKSRGEGTPAARVLSLCYIPKPH